MDQRFSYNISLSGENDINVLMPRTLFRFIIRVFYENTLVPELGRSSTLISSQTFFQEGPDFLQTLLWPLSSSLTPFGTDIIETIVNVIVDEILDIFQIDDVVASSSESQPQEVPLWIVINIADNSMHAATQDLLRTVSASEEAIDTLLKKSTVLQAECCCCICLDEFHLNAECYTLTCQHFFHKKCITRWLHTSQTCPMCRQPLRTPND
ncbi:probable E3 ubiquitin-protein ligase RHA4A [Vigna radiata var. radiata]|uniref:Probable E3 ubiquitin-protein ligase RHA4A n=1 Tax=Vigna radiata var. radiata TaxID=3916 RepID=A0A1S3TAD8_VIGRR|nr:probable E3 ubiquitin-protein ligase RHA4A [Vigna radiata var. radiata]